MAKALDGIESNLVCCFARAWDSKSFTSSKDRSLRICGNGMILFGRERGRVEEKDVENRMMRSQTLIWLSDKRGLDGAGM